MRSAVCRCRNGRSGPTAAEVERDDETRVDPDRCNSDVRSCLRHSRSLARYDAARRSDVAGDGIGGNDARRGRGCHRLCNITAAGRSHGQKLSGLDLSGLDLSAAILRGARLNRTKLRDAKLDRAILDQAWLVEADLSRASLTRASIFAAQMQRATLDGADLSGA